MKGHDEGADRVAAWARRVADGVRALGLGAVLLLGTLGLLGGVWPAAHARAQALPPDMADARGLELPPAPEGFVRIERRGVTWELPERARSVVEPLFDTWADAEPRIVRELGVEGDLPPIRIRVGIDPEQMRALAPIGAPPPSYAVGVAYPGLSLILLTLTAPETWQRPELDDVLVHELSHLALHHALGESADAPLWLIEGVAIYQARERSIERVQTLWEGTFRGDVIELDRLDARFPSRPHSVDLAYAQSADFVAWLLRRSGPHKLGEMVGRMRRGQRFEVAVSQTWSAGIGQLEQEWREDLAGRFGALPMFATGSAGWIAVGILVGLAWRRRRRKSSEIIERWAAEDARREQQELAYRRWRARQLALERQALRAEDAPAPGEVVVEGDDDAEVAATDVIRASVAAPVGRHTTHAPGGGSTEVRTFVVRVARDGAPSAPPRAASPRPVGGEAHEPAVEGGAPEPFEADVERGERPLH